MMQIVNISKKVRPQDNIAPVEVRLFS